MSDVIFEVTGNSFDCPECGRKVPIPPVCIGKRELAAGDKIFCPTCERLFEVSEIKLIIPVVLVMTDKFRHHGHELSKGEYTLLEEKFTHHGSCGCDGALDDGCPWCTEAKLTEWLAKIRE